MVQEKNIIQLKDKNNVKLYPKIALDSIDDGSISKEKLDPEVLSSKADKGIMIDIMDTGTTNAGIPVWRAVYDIRNSDIGDAFSSGSPVNFVIKDDFDYDHGSGEPKYHLIPVYYMYFDGHSSSIGLKAESKEYIIYAHPTASSDSSKQGYITQNRWYVHKKDGYVHTNDIEDKSVTENKLSDDIVKKINNSTTDTNVQQLQTAITTLNGDKTVTGSVDKKVSDAISNLIGSAPDTLNTLQKIAEEMQNPANNTATTVLDQVASKADSSALTEEITRAKAAEQANATNIATNTSSIKSLQNSMLYYEEISDL